MSIGLIPEIKYKRKAKTNVYLKMQNVYGRIKNLTYIHLTSNRHKNIGSRII